MIERRFLVFLTDLLETKLKPLIKGIFNESFSAEFFCRISRNVKKRKKALRILILFQFSFYLILSQSITEGKIMNFISWSNQFLFLLLKQNYAAEQGRE